LSTSLVQELEDDRHDATRLPHAQRGLLRQVGYAA